LSSTTDDSATGLALLGLLAVFAFGGWQYYQLNRDLDSIQDRAQIAANPQDMLGYVRTMRDNMMKHAASSGHTVLLMKTPANDLALHFQAVNSVIERLEQIQGLPAESAAFQTALDNLRGVLREMPRIASGVFWVRYAWWLALLALWCLVILGQD
jgi:hypothetical protein